MKKRKYTSQPNVIRPNLTRTKKELFQPRPILNGYQPAHLGILPPVTYIHTQNTPHLPTKRPVNLTSNV